MGALYFVRHGKTRSNDLLLLSGRSDHLLNEEGKDQAAALKEWFRSQGILFDRVYSSPLSRAVETAEIITGCSDIITDERLIEMDYGPYEGMDLRFPPQEVISFFSDFVNNPAPEGMEPLAEVTARLGSFLEEIREEAEKYNILIATHAIAMKGALEYLTPDSKGSYWAKNIRNCEVYKTEVRNERFSIPLPVET